VIQCEPACRERRTKLDSVDQDIHEVLSRNGYSIKNSLGRGGQGRVYRVYDGRQHTDLALKILVGQDGGARTRMAQEFSFLKTNNHPNLLNVFEFREAERNGVPYLWFTMELCRGSLSSELPPEEVDRAFENEDESTRTNLREIVALRRSQRRSVGRLHVADLRQRLVWVMECLDALAFIHQQGISHRDIKPANLLISTDGRLKLGDFGTAKLAWSNLRSSRSERTYLMGTPVYIAPELWRAAQEGDMAEQDLMRSDQYAFAITLVELLQRGKQLSKLEFLPSPPQTPAEFVLYHQVHSSGIYEDIRIPERDGTPESSNEVIKKLLSPNPYHRYDSLGRCLIDLVASFLKDNLLRA